MLLELVRTAGWLVDWNAECGTCVKRGREETESKEQSVLINEQSLAD